MPSGQLAHNDRGANDQPAGRGEGGNRAVRSHGFTVSRRRSRHAASRPRAVNVNVPGSALILSQWWNKGGKFAFGRAPISLLQQICPPPPPGAGPGNFSKSGFVAHCLSQHGYTQWTSYQPASRFWPFQLIEGGWLLALSLLLIGSTIWLVRRRAA